MPSTISASFSSILPATGTPRLANQCAATRDEATSVSHHDTGEPRTYVANYSACNTYVACWLLCFCRRHMLLHLAVPRCMTSELHIPFRDQGTGEAKEEPHFCLLSCLLDKGLSKYADQTMGPVIQITWNKAMFGSLGEFSRQTCHFCPYCTAAIVQTRQVVVACCDVSMCPMVFLLMGRRCATICTSEPCLDLLVGTRVTPVK